MQILNIKSSKDVISIDGWPEYLRDGGQFMQTAVKAHAQKKKAFNNEALYNLVCMGIEKYIMAVLMKNGDLAENHTMVDLLRCLENYTGALDIRDDLLYLDSFQEICSLEAAHYKTPDDAEIASIIGIGSALEARLLPLLS